MKHPVVPQESEIEFCAMEPGPEKANEAALRPILQDLANAMERIEGALRHLMARR